MNDERPLLVAVEGVDATGKTTLVSKLVDALQREGRMVYGVKNPDYNSYLGQMIRRFLGYELNIQGRLGIVDPQAEATAFQVMQCMGLHENYHKLMTDDRAVSADVWIMDRWSFSTQAYGRATEADGETLENITATVPEADLVLYLQCEDEEVLKERLGRREGLDRFEEKRSMVQEVQMAYADICDYNKGKNRYGLPNIHCIDTTEHDEEGVLREALSVVRANLDRCPATRR